MKTLILAFAVAVFMDSPKLLEPNLCSPECSSCFKENNPRFCYECADKYMWYDGICTPISSRIISGMYRPCISCGKYNYPTLDYVCKACPFPCETCTDFNNCLTCKVELGFQLNNITHMCECIKGYFKEGFCYCQNASYYLNETGDCVPCITGKRGIDNCPEPCPIHFFEYTINDCTPCHFSCNNCTDETEFSCKPPDNGAEPCRTDKGFEWISSAQLCMCVCNSQQKEDQCACEEGFTEVVNTTHKICQKI